MINTRGKLLVDTDPIHCCCEELPATSHEYKASPHNSPHNILEAPGNFYHLYSSDPSDYLTNSTAYPTEYPWNPLSPILTSKHQVLGHHPIDKLVYPSPPSTSSLPGRSVPLPNDCCKTPDSLVVVRPLKSQNYFGGILDSPPLIEHGTSKFEEPLSPPPTLPTQTLSLPPAEYDQPQVKEMDARAFFNSCQSNASIQQDGESCPHPLSPPLSPDWAAGKVVDVPFPASAQSSLFFPSIAHPTPLFLNNENSYISSIRSFDLHLDDSQDFYETPSTRRQWHPANVTMDYRALDGLSSHVSHLGLLCSPEQEDVSMASGACLAVDPKMVPLPPPTWRLDDLDSTLYSPLFPYPGSPPISSPASTDYEFDYHDYDDGPISPLSPPSSPSLRSFSELPALEGESDHLNHDEMLELPSRNDYFCNRAQPNLPQKSTGNDAEKVYSIRSFPGVETDDDLIPIDLASRSSAPEHCIIIPSTPYITPSTLIPYLESSNVDNRTLDSQLRHGDLATRFRGSSLLLYDDQTATSGSSRIDTELDQLDPVLMASDPELKRLLDLRSRTLASEKRARMVEAQYENIKASHLRDGVKGPDRIGSDDIGSDSSVEEEGREAQLHHQQEEACVQALLATQAKKERKREKERLREINALVKIKLRERGMSFKRTPPSPPASHFKSENMDADGILCGFLQDGDTAMNDHADKYGHPTKPNKDKTMPQLVARMILRRREGRLHPVARPQFGRSSKSSATTNDVDPKGKERSHRSSPLALPASTGENDETDHDNTTIEQDDDFLPHLKHHRPHLSPLRWHMDVDCHTCPDPTISVRVPFVVGRTGFALTHLSLRIRCISILCHVGDSGWFHPVPLKSTRAAYRCLKSPITDWTYKRLTRALCNIMTCYATLYLLYVFRTLPL